MVRSIGRSRELGSGYLSNYFLADVFNNAGNNHSSCQTRAEIPALGLGITSLLLVLVVVASHCCKRRCWLFLSSACVHAPATMLILTYLSLVAFSIHQRTVHKQQSSPSLNTHQQPTLTTYHHISQVDRCASKQTHRQTCQRPAKAITAHCRRTVAIKGVLVPDPSIHHSPCFWRLRLRS